MNHIDQLYLQIIYNTCVQNPTDFITIQPEDEQPLTELTKVQSTLPFLLSYIKNPTILNSLKHQTKLMLLNYYQIEQFTRRIADLQKKMEFPTFYWKESALPIFTQFQNIEN